ncbi:AraC family transcriptional regulator [Simiduia curdlanivorans]|uniref:AraC family transcriptional regulator n=1 Tax=Simiduia curdlanivorans TaxID=1492769 RepID=A0ABV8V3D6_9GAMM|nr:AraC family transcriptional regulator [Simiduia curdlanivorans]MDN3640933.1 AraC family transcriptional regulator [Simiduia curdlanivorans]
MSATTLTSWAVLIWQELESRGLDARRYFRACGLDSAKMSEAGARYPTAAMTQLWTLCIEQTGDAGFGAAVGARWNATTFHALGMAWLASSSLQDGLARFGRYGRLIADALSIDVSESGAVIRMTLNADGRAHPAAIDAAMAALVRMCRLLVGEGFTPLAIELVSVTAEKSTALADYVQCPIHYQAVSNCVLFDRADVMRSLPTGNAALGQANDAVALAYLSSLDKSQWSARVIKVIDDALAAGKVTEANVAEALNSSVRNLQRKLADEKTSFGALYENLRKEKASQYLAIGKLSLNEIAYLLGFSDPANFTRAFKRWYGQAPSVYRKVLTASRQAALGSR